MGKLESDSSLNDRFARMAVNECCHLSYTSGTTGPPKGVMISQDNITQMIHGFYQFYQYFDQEKGARMMSYLPMSHVAGLLIDVYAPLCG